LACHFCLRAMLTFYVPGELQQISSKFRKCITDGESVI